MLTFSDAVLMSFVHGFTAVLVRLSGLFVAAPLLSLRGVPRRWRAGAVMVLALLIATSVDPVSLGRPGDGTLLATAAEFAVGALMGFAVRLSFVVFDLAGELISQQAGLNFAQMTGLEADSRELVVGNLFGLLSVAIGFATNLHLVLIEALADSYRVVPFGRLPDAAQPAALLALLADAFQAGILVALPAVVFLLIANLLQAVLGRASPQFGQFAVGFSVTITVALAALMLIVPALGARFDSVVRPALELIRWTK